MSTTIVFQVLAGALAAAAAGLAIWALTGDRARGRRRCARCWYDLGRDRQTCSECGWVATDERSTARTRRRWGWMAASPLLLLVAAVLLLSPRVRAHGWVSLVPGAALVRLADTEAEHGATALDRELRRRVDGGHLSTAQYGHLIRRFLGEDGALPWDVRITLRERSPQGIDVHYGVDGSRTALAGPAWLWTRPLRVVVRPDVPGAETCAGPIPRGLDAEPRTYRLGRLPEGSREVSFDVAIRLAGSLPAAELDGPPIWRTRVTRRVEIGGGLEDLLEPVGHPAIEQALRRLRFRVVDGRLYVAGISRIESLGEGLALGARIELTRDGEVFCTASIWRESGGAVRLGEIALPHGAAWSSGGGEWRVRVRSDPALALRHLDASHVWSGGFDSALQFDGETFRIGSSAG